MAEQGKEFTGFLPSGKKVMFRIRGTIQEVLTRIAKRRYTASKFVSWWDDGTNAIAVFCEFR